MRFLEFVLSGGLILCVLYTLEIQVLDLRGRLDWSKVVFHEHEDGRSRKSSLPVQPQAKAKQQKVAVEELPTPPAPAQTQFQTQFRPPTRALHPRMQELANLNEYAFQPVKTPQGAFTNVCLVRAPVRTERARKMREEMAITVGEGQDLESGSDHTGVLFLGISSFEDWPLDSGNPFSQRWSAEQMHKNVRSVDGWLTMLRPGERKKWMGPSSAPGPGRGLTPRIPSLLMSQSDFALPMHIHHPPLPLQAGKLYEDKLVMPAGQKFRPLDGSSGSLGSDSPSNKYLFDFVWSASDQDVRPDGTCVGWSMYAKNWTFAYESLKVLCDLGLRGALIASVGKSHKAACRIPRNCGGGFYNHRDDTAKGIDTKGSWIVQTPYLKKQEHFLENYVQRSKFVWFPQVHDASPRVTTQALVLDTPILVNKEISGGWKYVRGIPEEELYPRSTPLEEGSGSGAGRTIREADGPELGLDADAEDDRQQLYTGELFTGKTLRKQVLKLLRNRERYRPRQWVLKHYGSPNSGKRLREWVQKEFSDRVWIPEELEELWL
jgi:hypothetical protein